MWVKCSSLGWWCPDVPACVLGNNRRTGRHFKLEDFLPSGVQVCFSGDGVPRNLTLDEVSESVLVGGSGLGASGGSIVPGEVVFHLLLHLVGGVAGAHGAEFSLVHV